MTETPQQFSTRAADLLRRALQAIGGPEADRTRLNKLMQEAKVRRLSWIEGLEFTVSQLQ